MEEFLKILTEQIRCVKARDGVARELADHILDQAQVYEQSGIEHDKAVEMAVKEMGDPVEIGVSLDRIHRPQTDWRMLLITFVLSVVGVFVMYLVYGPSNIVTNQCIYTLIGFVIITAVYFFDYTILGQYGIMLYIASTAIFLALRYNLPAVNGRVPALSMLTYLYVPLFAGILYRLRSGKYASFAKSITITFLTTFFVLILTDSVVNAMNIFLINCIMMIVAVNKNMFHANKKYMNVIMAFVAFSPVVAVFLYFQVCGATYQRERLRAFMHSMKIVQCQKKQLGFMVAISCFMTLAVNCCEGVLMNLGLWPATAIPIPFLTYGKSTVFVYSIFIGLLLSAHRYEKVFTREEDIYKPGWRLSIKLERK